MTPFARLLIDDGDVQSLFDTGEIEHVCHSLSTDGISIKQGFQRCLIEPLNKVIESLYQTGQSTFLTAALNLSDCASNVVAAIDTNLSPEMANEFSEILRNRWTDFVVHGSAHRVYHELPTVSKKASTNASKPRKKNPMRTAIIEAMGPSRKAHTDFKSFMQMWQLGHLHGLTARSFGDGKKYIIADENGDLGETAYTWGTLEKMYSS